MYKKINVNIILYKIRTITNIDSKNMTFIFKNDKKKEGWD